MKNFLALAPESFIISRVFDAPRERLWEAFTQQEKMSKWWGPKGFAVAISKMELRPGGIYHYCLRSPDGQAMWGKMVYQEIIKPERLVFINSFSDEKGNLTRHPYSATWPLQMHSTILFEDRAGKTALTVKWIPCNAAEEERKTFDSGRESMQKGWTGTLDQLGDYLAS